jgi:hypothetical protein
LAFVVFGLNCRVDSVKESYFFWIDAYLNSSFESKLHFGIFLEDRYCKVLMGIKNHLLQQKKAIQVPVEYDIIDSGRMQSL